MKRIKKAFDPDNILNPGVLINDDPDVFIKNLKRIPEANPLSTNASNVVSVR
jgi:D-lactate dehydrogenase